MVIENLHIIKVHYTDQVIKVWIYLTEISLLVNGFSDDIDDTTKGGPTHWHLLSIVTKKSAFEEATFNRDIPQIVPS